MPPVPPKLGLHTLFFGEGVRGVLRGERGNTFCVPAVLSCDTNTMHFSLTEKLVELGNVWRLLQKDTPYNPPRPMFTVVSIFADEEKCIFLDDRPACGNRQDKKRNATAKQMRGATGLTVLG